MRLLCVIFVCLNLLGCSTARAFQLRYTDRALNWISADSEYHRYKHGQVEAYEELRHLRLLTSLEAMASRIVELGITYTPEDVDFMSYAWVTLIKKTGDCDDFQELWREILNGKGKTVRVCVYAKPDKVHAALLFYPRETDLLYLLSNNRIWGKGVVGEEDRLIRSFYGECTENWYKY